MPHSSYAIVSIAGVCSKPAETGAPLVARYNGTNQSQWRLTIFLFRDTDRSPKKLHSFANKKNNRLSASTVSCTANIGCWLPVLSLEAQSLYMLFRLTRILTHAANSDGSLIISYTRFHKLPLLPPVFSSHTSYRCLKPSAKNKTHK